MAPSLPPTYRQPQTSKKPAKKTPQQEMQERITKLEKDQSRQDKRDRAVLRLGQFQSDFMARAESWLQAAKDIGSAYRQAFDKHNGVVSDQSNSDALGLQIIFSVLSVATAGGLSWVYSAVQNSTNAVLKHIVDGVKDAALVAADKVLTTGGPIVYAPNLRGGVNPDPQRFQNELEKKIGDVKKAAFAAFGQIYKAWEIAPLSDWDNYSEAQQMAVHKDWKNRADQLVGAEHLPTVEAMADELERGMWEKYILEQHSHRDFGLFETAESFDYVGDEIYKRLVQLHITVAAGLPPTPPGSMLRHYGNAQKYVEGRDEATNKLVAWAKAHTVRDFVSMKYPTRPR